MTPQIKAEFITRQHCSAVHDFRFNKIPLNWTSCSSKLSLHTVVCYYTLVNYLADFTNVEEKSNMKMQHKHTLKFLSNMAAHSITLLPYLNSLATKIQAYIFYTNNYQPTT
jgi:hypothetical protein